MNPFAVFEERQTQESWFLENLDPTPAEEWERMLDFLGFDDADQEAMLATVEPLFRRGPELVVGSYDYLLQKEETAAILGWENGADPAHLAERRRFFTVWLARLLGMDFSHDFADYLFHAGRLHAGHGPRQTHVPPVYITGTISLVNATFARFLMEETPGDPIAPAALAGWNKVLSLHLHLMLMGYNAARALDTGDFPLQVLFFGTLRPIVGRHDLVVHLNEGDRVQHALEKIFNYFPNARRDVFDLEWEAGERLDANGTPWMTTKPVYRIKPMWRVLLNGKDISYVGGTDMRVAPGDELHIFPPGR